MARLRTHKYPEPEVQLTYIKQSGEADGEAGDIYTGLDRFGRLVDQRWLLDTTALERVKFSYNRASNRVCRENLVASSGQDAYYQCDTLYQLTNLQRGDLNSGKTGIEQPPPWEEQIRYHIDGLGQDVCGNWAGYDTFWFIHTYQGTVLTNDLRSFGQQYLIKRSDEQYWTPITIRRPLPER